MSGTVLSRVANNVCTITLNRPERLNAINGPLIADYREASCIRRSRMRTPIRKPQ